MGNKGTYTRILDAAGLTEKERAFVMNYLFDEETQFNKEASIDKAGYIFEGVRPLLHKKAEANRILKKKPVLKFVDQILEERNNQVVWDKLWLLQQYKELYEDAATGASVKKGLLSDMAEIAGLKGKHAPPPPDAGKTDAKNLVKERYNARIAGRRLGLVKREQTDEQPMAMEG